MTEVNSYCLLALHIFNNNKLLQKTAEPADGSILALKIDEYQRTVQKLQNDYALKSAELSSKITENQLLSEELSVLLKI